MKIFIQGRKNGYNVLYPETTPAEFYGMAGEMQHEGSKDDAKCYGKSLYAIAFNGTGCIFTKCIIGYDTLRGDVGNIGISFFIPNNKKMLGTDIKILLDELINIYTTNYCPDFKINDKKQEDWDLFLSTANKYDAKVKTVSSDENFQYGNKEAAYIFYNSTTEIEKYLETPYLDEYKEYKQILFIDNQSQLILDVIKHDPTATADLTGKKLLENPWFKLRDYHEQGKNGVSIEISANKVILRKSGDKIFEKDDVTIKYSKKYCRDIYEEGKLSYPNIKKYIKRIDNSIDVEKDIELDPVIKQVEIRINDSKGNPITADITCKSNQLNTSKPVFQNTINFKGEEQKYEWTISAKKDRLSGEETFTPEHNSIVKLTLRDIKIFKLQAVYGANHPVMSKTLTFEDDKIRKEYTEYINIKGYKPQNITFIPENQIGDVVVVLQKQVIQQPISQGPKVGGSTFDIGIKPPKKRPYINILIASSIVCLLVVGVYFLVSMLWGSKTIEEQPSDKLTSAEIEKYVEGDSLFLEKLEKYKKEWAKLKNNDDSVEYKKCVSSIDRAIKKREAITNGDFAFLKDSARFIGPQMSFKNALDKINQNQYEQVITKLGDVSKLTLTQIADSINKILGQPNEPDANAVRAKTPSEIEAEQVVAAAKKAKEAAEKTKAVADANANKDETDDITNYLKGNELKIDRLNDYKNSSVKDEIINEIQLALDFWSLDGSNGKSYSSYKSKVAGTKYLKLNQTLKIFVDKANNETKYPKSQTGYKTKTLENIINGLQ